MPAFLVVANQTLASPTLAAAVAERVAAGNAQFHVVVPATPVTHGLTWDEQEAVQLATARLEGLLARLRALGAVASGEVGSQDPVAAAQDVLRSAVFDEIIVSTLPPGASRWLGQDVPTRLRRAVDIPVTVVTAAASQVETPAG